MKKLIGLGVAVAVIIALVTTGTMAKFSDTETSEDNQFTAGIIDLEIDCDGDTTFAVTDDPLPKIFNYLPATDIKPGDDGEVTLSLHLKTDSNDADLWIKVLDLENFGGLNPEPEQEEETATSVDDDIASEIEVLLWLETDGNNEYNPGATETILFGTVAAGGDTLDDLWDGGELTVKTGAVACTTYYLGWYWILPSDVGNEHQGDYCTFDVQFGADQITTP